MWWQGEDNAPDIVKLCWASLKKHCNGHRIIIITKDNYKDYVTLPEYILSKVEAGYITLTHLSDIIRVSLLAKYAGLWMDATLFVAEDIQDQVFQLEYFTIKRAYITDKSSGHIDFKRWTGFCFAARDEGNILFSFIQNMFLEYWKKHDKLIDYFLIDYLLAVAFDEFKEFRDAWNIIPINNLDWLKLVGLLGQEWNSREYDDIVRNTGIFKLTYKQNFDVLSVDGKKTVYAHLLSEYGFVSH